MVTVSKPRALLASAGQEMQAAQLFDSIKGGEK
jgi:hypothetical protein